MPQLILLNHAASYNYKRTEARSKRKAATDSEPVYQGKKLDELNSEEYMRYMSEGA